jgi:hypothetical protein
VTYDLTAKLTEVNDTYVAVELTTAWYAEGAAHEALDLIVYVVARATGERVVLADIFRSEAPALRVISRYARERLPVLLDVAPDDTWGRDTLVSGTAPVAASFERVTPRAEGLRVTFGTYQVASFAQGFPVLDVPWSLLRPYLAITPPSRSAS